jgi:hypothetical protein
MTLRHGIDFVTLGMHPRLVLEVVTDTVLHSDLTNVSRGAK